MSALTSVLEVTVLMEAAAQGVEERVRMATFVLSQHFFVLFDISNDTVS